MCCVASNHCARAAIYARVSSEQQAQAQTIASQVEALQERLKQDELELDQELLFIDDGYSGASLVRPALERLRDMAAMGVIERLYVHSPDRLARKYAYQVLLMDELHRCGIEVVFLNHQVGESPEDQLLLQVQGMVAEYERAKIMERCRRGKRHAARRGSVNVLCGAPYGYRYVSAGATGDQATYEVLIEQARVVRQIFQWVGFDRLSIQEVCRRLQKQGIRTATGKSWWDRTTVWGILKNPAYKGMAAFGKTRVGPMRPRLRPQRGDPEQPRRAHSTYNMPQEQWVYIPVPAIVEPALFDSVQEQLKENRQRQRQRRRGARYLLQGLLVCNTCGYAYYGKPVSLSAGKGKRRSYAYYRCIGSDAYRFGGQRLCWNKQVRTDLLEEAVWQDVCSLLKEPGRIEREHERRLAKPAQDSGLDHLKALVQKVKRGMGRLIDAYQDGLIDRTEFEPRMRHTQERLRNLNDQISKVSAEQSHWQDLHLVIGQLETFAKMLNGSLEQADWSTKRQVIRTLVKRIEICSEEVKMVYRIDSLPFAQAPNGAVLQHCLRRACTSLMSLLYQVLVLDGGTIELLTGDWNTYGIEYDWGHMQADWVFLSDPHDAEGPTAITYDDTPTTPPHEPVNGSDFLVGNSLEIDLDHILGLFPGQQPNPTPQPPFQPPAIPTTPEETPDQQRQIDDLRREGEGSIPGVQEQEAKGFWAKLAEWLAGLSGGGGRTIILVPKPLIDPILPPEPPADTRPRA